MIVERTIVQTSGQSAWKITAYPHKQLAFRILGPAAAPSTLLRRVLGNCLDMGCCMGRWACAQARSWAPRERAHRKASPARFRRSSGRFRAAHSHPRYFGQDRQPTSAVEQKKWQTGVVDNAQHVAAAWCSPRGRRPAGTKRKSRKMTAEIKERRGPTLSASAQEAPYSRLRRSCGRFAQRTHTQDTCDRTGSREAPFNRKSGKLES